MSFDWRTEEDEGWQEEAKSSETAVAQPLWRMWWWIGLIALLVLAGGWIVVQRQINQRVTVATGEVEAELLATHNFLLQTAVNQDEDLFRANLSGRNPDWVDVQQTLLNDGLLLDRPMFGWQHDLAQPQLFAEDISVGLSPNLRAAELIYPQDYLVKTPEGITETVTLQQTAVYREGSTRWLYAPPDEEFWGEWVTNSRGQVTLVYPQRDAAVAEQLAADLDSLLKQMCDTLADINCANEMRLHIRLDNEPDSLLEVNEIKYLLEAGLRLNLPAPTLVGLPIDEAGYDFLYRGYAVRVATAVLAHQTEYDCCTHQLTYRILRDYQLHQLGLQPWPIVQADFDALLMSRFDGHASQLWSSRWEVAPGPMRQGYALVEYLVQRRAGISVNRMMRLSGDLSYPDWLRAVIKGRYDENLFATKLLQYVYDQSQSGQANKPPISLPEENIKLVCRGSEPNTSAGIYEYDLVTKQWSQINSHNFDGQGTSNFQLSPNGEDAILMIFYFDNSTTRMESYFITDGEMQFLDEAEYDNSQQGFSPSSYGFSDPQGKYLIKFVYEENQGTAYLFEKDCLDESCPSLAIPRWPSWSPNGDYFLVDDRPIEINPTDIPGEMNWPIHLYKYPDQVAQVGLGQRPFWLNEEVYGFFQVEDENMFLLTAALGEDMPQPAVDTQTLLNVVAETERPNYLIIRSAASNPQRPQELLLTAYAGNPATGFASTQEAFLFKVILDETYTSIIDIEQVVNNQSVNFASYSPDGQFIITFSYETNSPTSRTTVVDQETSEVLLSLESFYSGLDWSSDGRWLAQNNSNYIMLHALGYDYQYLIPHSLENCSQVIWVNK